PERAITLPSSCQVGRQEWLELQEDLLNRAARGSRTVVCAGGPELHAAARDESDRRVEIGADALVGKSHVDQIVGVVDLESGRCCIAAEILTPGSESPDTNEKILVASEARGRVREIRARQPAAGAPFGIADGGNRANP